MTTEHTESDEDFWKPIEQTQERLKGMNDVDFSKLICEAIESYYVVRSLQGKFIRNVFNEAHLDDSWLVRLKLKRDLGTIEDDLVHIKTCPKCLRVFEIAVKVVQDLAAAK